MCWNSNLTLNLHLYINPHVKPGFRPSCTVPIYRFFNIQMSWTTVDNILLASSDPPCIHTFISLLSVVSCRMDPSYSPKSSLMFLTYTSNQSRCTQAACINQRIDGKYSRQRTYHQPTAEDPHETCLQGETLTEYFHLNLHLHPLYRSIVNSIVLTIIPFNFNPCLL